MYVYTIVACVSALCVYTHAMDGLTQSGADDLIEEYVANLIEEQRACIARDTSLDITDERLIDLIKGLGKLEMALDIGLVYNTTNRHAIERGLKGMLSMVHLHFEHRRSQRELPIALPDYHLTKQNMI